MNAAGAELTVVLPCAGAGKRFGAPYPKEMHCVSPGRTLLDLALAPILDYSRSGAKVTLIAVVNGERALTIAKLSKIAEELEVIVVFQAGRFVGGAAGALLAALPYCRTNMALVLPDQSFDWDPSANPLQAAAEDLLKFPISVIATLSAGNADLSAEGGLWIEQLCSRPVVRRAEEKPADSSQFNAAWVCALARADKAHKLVEVFNPGPVRILEGAPATLVKNYRNVTSPADAPRIFE